jgi:succinylglutamate desuccinylase
VSEINHYFDKFLNLSKHHPGPIPFSVKLQSGPSQIVIGTCVHGIETGSLPGVVEFIENSFRKGNKLPWTFVLGNPEAVLAEKRFLEADLNRQFDFANHADLNKQNLTLEKKRAIEIALVLDQAQFFLDFHQTNLPAAEAFYIFGFQNKSYLWARALQGAKVLVTRDASLPFQAGTLCADEYVRLKGSAAVTLELGEKGINPSATKTTMDVLTRLFELTHDRDLAQPNFEAYLKGQSQTKPELSFLQTTHKEPFLGQTLYEGLNNLRWFEKGEVLGKDLKNEVVEMPSAGYILFPKYPHKHSDGSLAEPMVGDLYHIVTPMNAHPTQAFVSDE